ncbi:MAG: hypothetical protein EAZ43_10105 [Betaproteobacteria bacterium]|nr:MAG: hypothetical protein EAZ43_10105 [Betaproteobacteria bacterium]
MDSIDEKGTFAFECACSEAASALLYVSNKIQTETVIYMLRWLSSLTDQRPLGSPSGARKFVATLDRDLFGAAEKVSTVLRSFSIDADGSADVNPAALLELESGVADLTARLERDYLSASQQAHSLRDRLWEAGYDWAMRFADAHRMVLASVPAAPEGKLASAYARVAIGYFTFRAMAYRYRLYRHEEWIPGNWRELNAQFRRTCDLGLDHKTGEAVDGGHPNYPARAFMALLLLRLGNAGSYLPAQTHTLANKLYEASFDARLTSRPAADGGFVLDLSGSDGLTPRHSVPQGGHFLFCDTNNIYSRMTAWLDLAKSQSAGANTTVGSGAANPLLALRSAVLRIDPEFKPLERASARNTDRGRVMAVYGVTRSASALGFDANQLAATLGGADYGYADAQEIQTLGLLRESTMKRLRQDLPPEASRLGLQFWHLRDRSDTGFRCVMPNAPNATIRLRDITVVSEESPSAGWQVAMIVRLLKLPAGHIELGLQVLTRDAEAIELRTLRSRTGMYRDNDATLSSSQIFKALRLKGAFFGRPIMDTSWIMASADYNAGLVYETPGSSRRYEATTVISEGSDWIWVQPTELLRQAS